MVHRILTQLRGGGSTIAPSIPHQCLESRAYRPRSVKHRRRSTGFAAPTYHSTVSYRSTVSLATVLSITYRTTQLECTLYMYDTAIHCNSPTQPIQSKPRENRRIGQLRQFTRRDDGTRSPHWGNY